MDCKKTIIDYLEGRIKPAELEELFETHPGLVGNRTLCGVSEQRN